ncbi:hypothetical protein EMCRGX_G001567 [Ephydatia muelleri]
MEVLRESATIVRNWLGAYSCPLASASFPLVLRPDRLGLGATPEVVSEEGKKRRVLGDKIGRKLKKARKVQEAEASLSTDGTASTLELLYIIWNSAKIAFKGMGSDGDEEEEPLSRSNAVRERTHHPLSTETSYQRLGKRNRKKQLIAPSLVGARPLIVSSKSLDASGNMIGASGNMIGASPGDGIALPNGKSGCGSDSLEPDGNSLACSSDSTPSPSGDGDSDKGSSVAESGESKAVVCSGTTTGVLLLGKMKSKQSFNFSISLSRSPYSRVRDRCLLTRSGSRTRHRRNICTK